MKIVNKYTDKITDLITSDENYELNLLIGLQLIGQNTAFSIFEKPEIILNVLSQGGTFQGAFTLEHNTDFYIKTIRFI